MRTNDDRIDRNNDKVTCTVGILSTSSSVFLFSFTLFLISHAVIYIYYYIFYSSFLKSVWHSLFLVQSSIPLPIINVTPIDGNLLPSVRKLDSHSRIYYGIVADGRCREKHWQHRYDMRRLYLQYIIRVIS